MLSSIRNENKILSLINGFLIDLPTPSSISYLWNMGSLLGLFLGFQIMTGLFLALHYCSNIDLSFYSLIHMMRDVNYGWLIRIFHANGASLFFMFMYLHMGRGLYYGAFRNKMVWMSGVTILLVSMATAFLGYVLPWGQMSFWAATVITNLLSAIPYVGKVLVEWIWGGFAVGDPTLVRFFAFHFILPFILLFLVVLHLLFLHEVGSSNPLGVSSMEDSVVFHPFFIMSDLLGLFFVFFFYFYISFIFPMFFMDVENFIVSNPLVTPVHIQPEWYFLFAYTILRSISSKIGGVLALVMSVMIFYLFPFVFKFRFNSMFMMPLVKGLFWILVVNWGLLTWIGACEVEMPFMQLGMIFSFMYFLLFILLWFFNLISMLIM